MRRGERGFTLLELVMALAIVGALVVIAFSYLDEGGAWHATWDTEVTKRLPRAIRISVGGTIGGRAEALLPLTVPLRVGTQP